MRQSIIIGLVLCAIGLVMSAAPNKLWEITAEWKSDKTSQPSKRYLTQIRIISGACIGLGVLFVSGALS